MTAASDESLPAPLSVSCTDAPLDELLGKEWLIANGVGAYASSTVVGCNTRRYHGLLVAASKPPVGRIMALSAVVETLTVDGHTVGLGTNEFFGAFSPAGWTLLETFIDDVAPRFVYRVGEMQLIKEVLLAEAENAVAVRYTLTGGRAELRLRPLAAMRDYHHVRSSGSADHLFHTLVEGGIAVQDRDTLGHALFVTSPDAPFQSDPQWWRRFRYRADIARGHDEPEDLYAPGVFSCELADGVSCLLVGSLDEPGHVQFDTALRRRRDRLNSLAASVESNDLTTRRLAIATDAFIVRRAIEGSPASTTILAGYPWFADWGRDAFVALPGLLLATKRFESARGVFRTFAASMADGLIPNCFGEEGVGAGYNSIDASLWYIIAAERYLAATDDMAFWQSDLLSTTLTILRAYADGTRYDIRADRDGLLTGGTEKTQLTWMDAATADGAITPRHGKAVEVNALWYAAHAIVAERCRGLDESTAAQYTDLTNNIGAAFVEQFWNPLAGCLYDHLAGGRASSAVRPNQILAVSLPYSPLPHEQQQAVVGIVERQLLTPYGLRTLASNQRGYRGRYEGDTNQRDAAYHQGTVWPWLLGPFIEAYLKVHGANPAAMGRAWQWLGAFDAHLLEAGLGSISEIFDGDRPQEPKGCFAQAWSVGEILRVRLMIEDHLRRLDGSDA